MSEPGFRSLGACAQDVLRKVREQRLQAAPNVVDLQRHRPTVEPDGMTLHRRHIEARRAQTMIARGVDKLVTARSRAEAVRFLREKIEQIEG